MLGELDSGFNMSRVMMSSVTGGGGGLNEGEMKSSRQALT